MACIPRLTHPITRIPFRACPHSTLIQARATPSQPNKSPQSPQTPPLPSLITKRHVRSSAKSRASWFAGLVQTKPVLPDITKAGDPVLHEPAQEVRPDEISSEKVQKVIDDMVNVMRKVPGVGLAAPQIGVPLRVMFVLCASIIELCASKIVPYASKIVHCGYNCFGSYLRSQYYDYGCTLCFPDCTLCFKGCTLCFPDDNCVVLQRL